MGREEFVLPLRLSLSPSLSLSDLPLPAGDGQHRLAHLDHVPDGRELKHLCRGEEGEEASVV